MANTPVLEVPVPLTVPVPVKGEDGRGAKRDAIIMRRPKTRHAKQLAIVIGADAVKLLMDAPENEAGKLDIDPARVAVEIVQALVTGERLEGLTAILADLCGEEPALIDELDLADLVELAKAFARFFPSLQSFASSISLPK